jgi:hypothetical protein
MLKHRTRLRVIQQAVQVQLRQGAPAEELAAA